MNLNKSPLVSICILCYNHEKYVSRVLESCLNQTYGNIEIIIVDNASLDNSVSIIEEYDKKFERIKFFKLEENIFPSGGLNFLINQAKGEYISPISADDYYEPNKIATQLQYMLDFNYTNSFTWVNIVDDNSNVILGHPFNNLFNRDLDNEALKEFFISSGNTLCAASVMLHKSIFEKYGLFDHRLLQLQDYELWLRIIKNEPINILQNKLTNYCIRDDGNNLSSDMSDEVIKRSNFEQMYMMKHIIDFELEVISKITGKTCTANNKYKNMLDYYIQEKKYTHANGIMYSLYENLGNDFVFPSLLYKDFFDIYSKYDPSNIQQIQHKDRQIQEQKQQMLLANNTLNDKEVHIQNQNNEIQHWHNLAQSLRIKNRIKKYVPKKIWKILRYIKHNPNAISLGLHILKTQGFRSLLKKINKVETLSESRINNSYIYINPNITDEIKSEVESFRQTPLISIIMPVYNVDPKWLKLAIKSIENQWYKNWELCIADDKSTKKETIEYLKNIKNPKIKIKFLEKNLNISGASNEALTLACGEYVALMDNDDEITPDALYEVVKAINETDAEFIYSDEDKLEMDGTFSDPHFKPDYAPDMILSQNYISHLGVIKKSLIDKVGGFTLGSEGAQDYDLYLKVFEHTSQIIHIQKVLYHWRKIPGSTAANFSDKSYAQDAGVMTLEHAMERRQIKAKVLNGKHPGTYRVKYDILGDPLVSIVIPFKDKPELLTMCIESILDKSTYQNFEIIGISNNSNEQDTFDEMKRLESLDNRIKFYKYNVPFNYSEINNYAVHEITKGEQIILLNNDIEIITSDWIESMLEHSQRKSIGCVGAKLYYPNNTIQHAGVIIGIGGVAGHSHKYLGKNYPGYFSRLTLVQNLSAVTAACMMVKKSIYKELHGLNKNDLKIAFNDVDFCLRVREAGYLNIFTPHCEAYHHESISRGHEDNEEKIERFNSEVDYMLKRHQKILAEGDPYYNSNLTLNREDFSLRWKNIIKKY